MFYEDSWGILRILIITPLAYLALLVMLRVSGKRSLSKMNAFDFVVTVALGSMLASTITSKSVKYFEGLLAMALLLLLQFIITWSSVRSQRVSDLVKNKPALLMYNGIYQRRQMTLERVTESEIQSAIRDAGHLDASDVAAVVLETDGSFAVISGNTESQDLPIGLNPDTVDRRER